MSVVIGSLAQGGNSWLLHSHCSLSVRRLSLSSCSKSLSWVASESCSSFEHSSSIACSSSVISCISAAVCLALSLQWLHKLAEGPAVVNAFGVDLATFLFILPMGLAFPLSGVFLFCPVRVVFVIWGFEVTLLLVTLTGHETVMKVSVVVATTACKSLYLHL